MPRKFRDSRLETRTARLKLKSQGLPYYVNVALGIRLGYRAGPGTWSVNVADGQGGKKLTSLKAIADDHEDADGDHVLTFHQASDKARAFARGHEQHGVPGTIDECLIEYERELQVLKSDVRNARRVRIHLTPQLLAKPLGLFGGKVIRRWRDDLLANGMSAATFTRTAKSLRSALFLAADRDPRLDHMRSEWRKALAAIRNESEENDKNIVLTPTQCHALRAACYDIGPEFGLYIETLEVLASRPSQVALLNVEDLRGGAKPTLAVPTSLKGKKRTSTARSSRIRKRLPIPAQLAAKLTVAAAGRPRGTPLLPRPDGGRWCTSSTDYARPFACAAAAVGLPDVTAYSLRHTGITAMLLKGVPIRVVADFANTSVGQIEKTYSRNIGSHSDDLIRTALFQDDAPAAESNVVSLRR
jgi:integrase